MPFSAKSLLKKAKDIEAMEIARQESELRIKREQRKIEIQKKKKYDDFIKNIGCKCIEQALNNETHCLISEIELKTYKSQIQSCGLDIYDLQLTYEELKDEYPQIYEDLGIQEKLDSEYKKLEELKGKLKNLDSENSKLFNKNLAKYNDELYEIFNYAYDDGWYEDGWHITLIEKKIIDEISITGFNLSAEYDSDHKMVEAISELLNILEKYKVKGLNDPDSKIFSETTATDTIQELIDEIPTIKKELKNHDQIIRINQNKNNKELDTLEEKIEALEELIDSLHNQTYTLHMIQWLHSTKRRTEDAFPNPETLTWIGNNPLMEKLFKTIENKILEKCKLCEFLFVEYGPRYTHNQYLCDGLYFEDFLIEISITNMQNIFESLGYKVKVSTLENSSKDPSNLIQKHQFKITWPSN